VAIGLDRIHRQLAAIEPQMAQHQVTHVDQADRIGTRPRDEAQRRSRVGGFDDDRLADMSGQIVER
jgi:hypothetical protein